MVNRILELAFIFYTLNKVHPAVNIVGIACNSRIPHAFCFCDSSKGNQLYPFASRKVLIASWIRTLFLSQETISSWIQKIPLVNSRTNGWRVKKNPFVSSRNRQVRGYIERPIVSFPRTSSRWLNCRVHLQYIFAFFQRSSSFLSFS